MHPLRELTLDELRRRTSVKWREFAPDVLPLWVAEMDVRLAEPIARVLTDAVTEGDTGYPHGPAYAEAFVGFAAERWSWHDVEPARTALVADVMTGISEALGLISSPGDPVVVNSPVYPPFFGFVGHTGREIVEAPLGADGRLDLDAIEAAFIRAGVGGRPVTYLLCNPHNPTAVAPTLDELTGIAGLAQTYAVRVVVDEIHAPLAEDFVPYLTVPGTSDAFVLASASKAWNLAGMKAALLIAGPDAADDLERLPEVVGHGPSQLGVLAHTAAYREGGPWLDALRSDLADNRVLLAELLAAHLPDARWGGGPATYLAWIDCRGLGLGDDPAAGFLERGRVAVNSGLPFGTGGAGHIRLNFASTPEILTEAVERMSRVIG